MIRLIVTAASAVGLILFVAFVASRLLRARTSGFSIRLQIFLALASIVGAFAFGLGVLVLDRIEARATLLAGEAATDEAEAIAAIVGGEMEARAASLDEIGEKLAAASGANRTHLRLSIRALDGRTILAAAPPDDPAGTVEARAPIVVRGAEVGSVAVLKPTLVIRKTLADFAPTILAISVVLGAAAAAAAALIGRAIARPIEGLTDFAERVSLGRREAPPPFVEGREVQRLTKAIDSMRRELEGRPFVEAFAADLSHELKNPVAAIRASAEVLVDGAIAEPEEALRFVQRIREACARIEALLGDLLSLARIEARGVEDAGAFDLAEVAREVVARIAEGGRQATFVGDLPAPIRGSRTWIARAVENLVDNAVLHGAAATVVVRVDDEHVELDVTNPGEIPRHVGKRLFRRFVTTRADRGGTGLGLAIVRAVAEAHRGTVECTAKGPPEVVFRLRLPAG